MWWQIVKKREKWQAHDQVKADTFILTFAHLNDKIHSAVVEQGFNVLESKNDKDPPVKRHHCNLALVLKHSFLCNYISL